MELQTDGCICLDPGSGGIGRLFDFARSRIHYGRGNIN